MMRSLWSGVAGLTTHQLEMDVIGNNIANVNTTAYKSQATGFADILYQTVKNGTGSGDTTSTTNVSQVGLGSRLHPYIQMYQSQAPCRLQEMHLTL